MTTNGNDLIYGTSANTLIDGKGGTDTVSYGRVQGNISLVLAGNYLDVYKANGSVDTLTNVEAVSATGGNGDLIFGYWATGSLDVNLQIGSLRINSPTVKTLVATQFDHVWGSNFNDRITGSSNGNLIKGAGGADVLTGGAGADVFSYDFRTDSFGTQVDTITDFTSGQDKIALRCFDANPATAVRDPLRWVGDIGYHPKGVGAIGFGQVGLDGSRLVANVEGGLFVVNIANPSNTFNFRNPILSDMLL